MPDSLLKQSNNADATMAGDRAAIYHRETRKAITLNPSGTILWQALETPCTRADLVKVLQARWPQIDDETAGADVDKFIDQLRTHELVED